MTEQASEEQLGLSVILPAYNEAESVGPLYEATVRAVEPVGTSFEIIFVDDGSSDDTFARCAALAAADRPRPGDQAAAQLWSDRRRWWPASTTRAARS